MRLTNRQVQTLTDSIINDAKLIIKKKVDKYTRTGAFQRKAEKIVLYTKKVPKDFLEYSMQYSGTDKIANVKQILAKMYEDKQRKIEYYSKIRGQIELIMLECSSIEEIRKKVKVFRD